MGQKASFHVAGRNSEVALIAPVLLLVVPATLAAEPSPESTIL
jgi:hypothetical protein